MSKDKSKELARMNLAEKEPGHVLVVLVNNKTAA